MDIADSMWQCIIPHHECRNCEESLAPFTSEISTSTTMSSQEVELKQVGPRKVGGRTEVKDVEKNMEVQQLGHFAVQEFNRRRTTSGFNHDDDEMMLLFSRVVQAQCQVVSGIKYFLTVVVKVQAAFKDDDDGNGVERVFEAVVWLKPWLHDYKQLLSFKPSLVK